MIRGTLLAVPLIVAGCTANGGDRPAQSSPAAGQCDARLAQRFVGTPLQPTVPDRAMRASKARTVRVIRPGQAVTMDFREDRLNVELDEQGRVASVRCG